MPRVGLVLGAGGVVGQAYHAGALWALERELGWDARSAEIVVGTSAGSVTGTLLRLGIPASDLAARALDGPLSEAGEAIFDQLLPRDLDFPPMRPGLLFRPWRPPSSALVARAARRPWAFRPQVAAMTLLPAGPIDLSVRAEPLHAMVGDAWPDGLWICAARRTDGARVVFGRAGSPAAPLASAVVASCAIPGYFSPVNIGGVEYFDGGVYSPSNANVLRGRHLDAVVVISPMSAASRFTGSADGPLRWSVHRRLHREVARLEAEGTTVVTIEPGPGVRAAMGLNAMAEDRSARVVRAAYDEVLAHPPLPLLPQPLAS